MLALSVQGGRWWSLGDVSVGPAGSPQCFGGECTTGGLSWVGGGDLFMRAAVATLAGGLICAVALIVLAAGTAAGRVPTLAAKTTIAAALTVGVAGAVFIGLYPGVPGAGIDRGLPLFLVGVVGAVTAAVIVLRAARRAT